MKHSILRKTLYFVLVCGGLYGASLKSGEALKHIMFLSLAEENTRPNSITIPARQDLSSRDKAMKKIVSSLSNSPTLFDQGLLEALGVECFEAYVPCASVRRTMSFGSLTLSIEDTTHPRTPGGRWRSQSAGPTFGSTFSYGAPMDIDD